MRLYESCFVLHVICDIQLLMNVHSNTYMQTYTHIIYIILYVYYIH